MSNTTKGVLGFLFVLVIISLALNVFLVWQWFSVYRQAQQLGRTAQLALAQAVADLGELKESTIRVTVPVQEAVPIKTNVPFNQTITVPINESIPFEHQIETQLLIEMPEFGVNVPIDVTVPIKTKVPVVLTASAPVSVTIPVETTVPLNLEIPVALKIGDTGLAPYIDRLRAALISINESLSEWLN
ncbi:MAG: hypothetical protein ACE5G8_09530 [Anaerolineae bacterium]